MCKPLKLFPPEKPYDISGYYIEKFTTNPKYTIFENWFFVAQKNNLLIKLWKDELFKCLSFEDDNAYVESVLNDGVDLQGIPKKLQAYLSIHVAFQVVLQKSNRKFNIEAMPASAKNGPFEYLAKNDWNTSKAINYLINENVTEMPNCLKLRGGERKVLMNKWDSIKRNSILGKLIEKVD